MTARASCNMRSLQDEDPQPDLTTFMMARAMAEMFQDDPDSPDAGAISGHPAEDGALGRWTSMSFSVELRPLHVLSCESWDLTHQTVSDRILSDVLGCSLSSRLGNPRAWARQAVKSRSRAAVRQRRRA